MRKLVMILMVCALGCGGKKDSGGETKAAADNPFPDGAAVIKSMTERVDAACGCADSKCRFEVGARPNDPMGEKARTARDGMSGDEKKAYAELLKKWTECATRK